jgi:outer membrane protein assembly factor BamB
MNPRPVIPWAIVAAAALGLPAAADGPDPAREDEQTLAAAHVSSAGPDLVEFFRKHTPVEADRDRIRTLIRELGDDSYPVRERASAELVALGPAATPLLKEAEKDSDVEVARRAERCRQLIEPYPTAAVATAAARLLALRRPAGAVEALLGYLPAAEDDSVADAVRRALTALAHHDGRPEPALVAALDDRAPARRAAAVHALIRSAPADERRPLRRYLRDPEPPVRLEAALALARTGEKDAVPVLIELLTDLPPGSCWRVEDVLCRLAGDDAPSVSLGTDPAGRARCRDAWRAWWAAHGDKADLARLAQEVRPLGYTLVVELNRGLNGRVVELDADGRPRWQIENLQYPIDAQVVGDDRVLIAEYRARRVSERDFKGDVKWEKSVSGLLQGIQRLPNGNTFIVTRNQLLEVDRRGHEVAAAGREAHDIMAARKLRNGEVLVLTLAGVLQRLGADGKELGHFAAGATFVIGINFDALPSGRVVVPQYNLSKVVEFDRDGQKVWEAEVGNPNSVYRLPSGNTLVGSMVNQRAVELDRAGKEVWEYKAEGRLMRVRRR